MDTNDSAVRGFWYPRTATGRASLLPPPPWHYSGDLLTVEYRTDPGRIAELLPPPLLPAPDDPGAVALIWADWQSCGDDGAELLDPVRAQYRECFAVVRCAYRDTVYSRCVYIWVDKDFALARGLHQGYPKKLGSIQQTRPHPFGRAAPRIAPGGRFAGTLAAADRRLAHAVVTLREEAGSAGFVNAHPMAHHRWVPSIEKGAPDSLDELVLSASAGVQAGPAWRGDATLELFESPAEELARLEVREVIAGYYQQLGVSWDGGKLLSSAERHGELPMLTDIDARHWIDGRRVASAQTFTDLSPIDSAPLAHVARGGAAEVDAAVLAARRAFGGWSRTPPAERAALLRAIAGLIDANVPDLARVETLDNGALLRSHLRSVMPRVARNFRFFADWLGKLGRGDLSFNGHEQRVSWDPSGVTAIITPWNAPLMLATWRIAAALAAGNTVVAKPPEWAPLTAGMLAGLTREAGLADGVFNVVHGLGDEAGAPLVAHPDVARVCFTGSVATGRLVAAAAGAQLTPVSLELGGKSPLIVFADADLDLAVRHAVGQYDNAGQVCLAGTRLLVASPVADEFLARFTGQARALRLGDPREEGTDIGPLITRSHFDRVDGFVRRAIAAGATPVIGGGPDRALGGLYYQPTLLTGVEPGAEILAEEVFGPVLTMQRFDDEDAAVELANSTRYGLAATVFTGDRSRARRIAARLVAGTVWVNCFFVRDLRAPFGGAGQSGIGREGGDWSFDFYSDVKNTVYAPQGWTR